MQLLSDLLGNLLKNLRAPGDLNHPLLHFRKLHIFIRAIQLLHALQLLAILNLQLFLALLPLYNCTGVVNKGLNLDALRDTLENNRCRRGLLVSEPAGTRWLAVELIQPHDQFL